MHRNDKLRYMTTVRSITYGWALRPPQELPGILRRAERAVNRLPEELLREGENALIGLRRAIANLQAMEEKK